jgi:hypothetical protein
MISFAALSAPGFSRSPITGGIDMIAFSILRASIKAMLSTATTDCWPLRTVAFERKRVVP